MLNSYLVTQGGEPVFGAQLFVKAREPIALFAIIIGAPLLILSAMIARLYATRIKKKGLARIPLFWFDEIDTNSPEGRWYQRLVILVFTVLPALSFLHFIYIVISGNVCAHGHITTVWDSTAMGFNDAVRLGGELSTSGVPGGPTDCAHGITFFPIVEPIVLVILIGAAYLALYCQFQSIYRGEHDGAIS